MPEPIPTVRAFENDGEWYVAPEEYGVEAGCGQCDACGSFDPEAEDGSGEPGPGFVLDLDGEAVICGCCGSVREIAPPPDPNERTPAMYSYAAISKAVTDRLEIDVSTDRASDGTYGVWLWLGDLVHVWLEYEDATALAVQLDDAVDTLAAMQHLIPEDSLVG